MRIRRPGHRGLAAYSLGVLDAEAARAFEAHLRRCPACRRELGGLRAVVSALGQAEGLGYLPPGNGPGARTAPARKQNTLRVRCRWLPLLVANLLFCLATMRISAPAPVANGVAVTSRDGERVVPLSVTIE
ncbi:Putative zinc-finger [Amycolatopsis xylanica]|uniref:Putative zinc-finger n=1 Tax=Amycolatopsis xylanica TaxID=589385 RepID=A0A1H3SIZ0_9PSEU|nr:zf-HC2 domain-containing protein [Amycolatopsis xylanica]SDZ37966.1 Putative zinc-finger [Amycolatopsis xylanica]